jgi:hypothetical protein
MRKSIIAGLTLCAALAFAAQAQAEQAEKDNGALPANHGQHGHKHPNRVAQTQPKRTVETQPPTYFRIPANPVVRDCVHVTFPQCSGKGGFNDGTFQLPY